MTACKSVTVCKELASVDASKGRSHRVSRLPTRPGSGRFDASFDRKVERHDPRCTGAPRLGPKVRALRRRESLSQVQLAERLGISPSYLNLIESNRRPLPATLLIKLAQLFGIDLHTFGGDDDARLVNDLLEAFADPAVRRLPAHVDRPAGPRRQPPADGPGHARALHVVQDAARSQRGARVPTRRRGGGRARPVAAPVRGGERSHPEPHELLPRARGGRRRALEEGPPRPRGALSGARSLPRQAARGPRADRARRRRNAGSCGASTRRRRSSR